MARGATYINAKTSSSDGWWSRWRARLNLLAVFILVLSLLALLVVLARTYRANANWRVERVQIDGELRQLNSEQLMQALDLAKNSSLLGLDLPALQARIQRLPWVKQAALRRVYPSRLVLTVSEREPWLRLNNDALIDRQGLVFTPANVAAFEQLAQINTGENMLALALIQYSVAAESLRPLGLAVSSVNLSSRQALSMQLNNGVNLLFGREDWENRLARVVRMYPGLSNSALNNPSVNAPGLATVSGSTGAQTPSSISTTVRVPMYIDVRYDTGFAVAYPPQLDSDVVRRTAGL